MYCHFLYKFNLFHVDQSSEKRRIRANLQILDIFYLFVHKTNALLGLLNTL